MHSRLPLPSSPFGSGAIPASSSALRNLSGTSLPTLCTTLVAVPSLLAGNSCSLVHNSSRQKDDGAAHSKIRGGFVPSGSQT
ncbi:hypothetical protein CALCODRAFT_492361 [Calocera cornea HHB12733]|uniref:Uncharacterized protein n=1 Tax=Calocera cornea HHB12733 TaxID=1353952 RepID=A0A165IGZ7_9BASI|nr:hypothetical protein CALCODRAFT_492361 [Calocera cornea HHB12733]